MARPELIRILLEEDRFDTIGRLPDGTQFMAFITGAFPTGQKYHLGDDWQQRKKWLAVVHRFDADGNHLATEARLGAFDSAGQKVATDKALTHLETMYAELCAEVQPEFCDIWVRLFSVEIDNVTYGLFYEQSDEEDLEIGEERQEWAMLEPQNIMFHPPWDSGEYSS
jgi:hypothetical protein